MSLNANELFASADQAAAKRWEAHEVQPKTFAIGSLLLALLTPLAKLKSTGHYQRWTAPETEVNLITPTGTVSGGTFTITVNGETTGNIAYNANAATIKDALVALGGIDPDDVTVTGGPLSSGAVTFTWGGKLAKQAIAFSCSTGSITGGGSIAASEGTAGIGDGTGAQEIAGFAAVPEGIQLDADEQVIGLVMMKGIIHFDDIPVVSGYTSNQLKEALRNGGVREKGFTIQGLTGV